MVNLPTTTALTTQEVTQIAKCFESLASQYQTLGQIFRGALDRPSQTGSTNFQFVDQNKDTPKTTKRKRKERDPNAPTRPMSAYLLFCQEVREKMSPEELEANKGTAMMRLTGARWGELSPSDKKKFTDLAEIETKKYKENMARYLAQTGEPFDPESPLAEEPVLAPLEPVEIVAEVSPARKKRGAPSKKANDAKPDVMTPPAESAVPEPTPKKSEAPKAAENKTEAPKGKASKKKKSGNASVEPVHVIEPAVPEPSEEPCPVTVTLPEEQTGKKKNKKGKKKNKVNGVAIA